MCGTVCLILPGIVRGDSCKVNHSVWNCMFDSTWNSQRWFLPGQSSCSRGRGAGWQRGPGRCWGWWGTWQCRPGRALGSVSALAASGDCLPVFQCMLRGLWQILKTHRQTQCTQNWTTVMVMIAAFTGAYSGGFLTGPAKNSHSVCQYTVNHCLMDMLLSASN